MLSHLPELMFAASMGDALFPKEPRSKPITRNQRKKRKLIRQVPQLLRKK